MAQAPRSDLRMTTHLGVVRETGEIVDVEMPVTRGRKRKGRRKVYALMDLESIDRLKLRASEWSVLHRVMRSVNPETNIAGVTQSNIADDLGMTRPAVTRAMKTLMDRRIVYLIGYGQYRINSHIMFRGSNQDWDLATETEIEPEWSDCNG